MYSSVACLGEMEPARECCILQSQTQVIVTPKFRALSHSSHSIASDSAKHELASASLDNSVTHGNTSHDNVHNLTEVMLSQIHRLIAGFRWFLFGSETDSGTSNISESLTYKTEAWNVKTRLFCRILALEEFAVSKLKNNITRQTSDTDDGYRSELKSHEMSSCSNLSVDSIDLLQQPTNVYVSIFTMLSQLTAVSLDSVPSTFLATLSHLQSPSQQLAATRIQHAKSARSSSEDMNNTDSPVTERKVVVRVIVTNFNSESRLAGFRFMQPLPEKHVLISSLLRRQMNMSVTDKVALTPVCLPSDVCPAKINVYPLFSSVSSTEFAHYNNNNYQIFAKFGI